MKVFVILDRLAGTYGNPVFQPHKDIMIRAFDHAVNNENVLTEASDYELYYMGEYNASTGKLDLLDQLEFIKRGEVNVK